VIVREKRVLLSSICKPFGKAHGDGFGVHYEGTHQIMWAQGIFRPRGVTTQWGIDFIAANLQAPVVTLHYPSMKQFIRELRKGYDYVGIAFVATTVHKMRPMVEAVRRHVPNTKIVLGGYGTTMADAVLPEVDHICRGEGVAFMRELLGESIDAPIIQPHIIQDTSLFSLDLGRIGYVFAGLGCPNGCDFCVTSHYFKRRHLRLLPDGAAILAAIQRLHERDPTIASLWISDEDFLLNRARGREFLEAIRSSGMPPQSISVFASVKALSHFTAAELVEMGIDWIWIGYEGHRAGYKKMTGRSYEELFADLHHHGISILASMIIGFDYQTPEIIENEFLELMRLRPTMSQFLIYGPAYGTPLNERMKEEGRLLPTAEEPDKHDGFNLVFEHPNIGVEEMQQIQRQLFHREYELLGPSVHRVIEDWTNGYANLKDHPAERVRAKAEWYSERVHRAMAMLPASKKHLPPGDAGRVDALFQRISDETGPQTFTERSLTRFMPALMRWTEFKDRHGLWTQPPFTRKTFRMTDDTTRAAHVAGGEPETGATSAIA
jgi:hypothetical protein